METSEVCNILVGATSSPCDILVESAEPVSVFCDISVEPVDYLCKSCKVDDCPIICEAHQSGFFWNSWCLMDGAELETDGLAYTEDNFDTETSGPNACDCAMNQKWKFRGTGFYRIDIPEESPLDALVLWGHNLHNGSDDGLSFGTVRVIDRETNTVIQPTNWDDAYATVDADEPVIMFFDGTSYKNIEVQINGATTAFTSADDTPHTVGNLFIGEWMPLPEGLRKFASPFNASEQEAMIKASECGPLSRKLKRVAIDLDLTLECLCYDWLRTTWRPFLKYLQTTPVYFAWSRNRYPDEVCRAWLDSKVGPSEFTDSHFSSVTLPLKCHISQQLK